MTSKRKPRLPGVRAWAHEDPDGTLFILRGVDTTKADNDSRYWPDGGKAVRVRIVRESELRRLIK